MNTFYFFVHSLFLFVFTCLLFRQITYKNCFCKTFFSKKQKCQTQITMLIKLNINLSFLVKVKLAAVGPSVSPSSLCSLRVKFSPTPNFLLKRPTPTARKPSRFFPST